MCAEVPHALPAGLPCADFTAKIGTAAAQLPGRKTVTVGRVKDELLRSAFITESALAEDALARRDSAANVQEFLNIMYRAGAEPEPFFVRDPDAAGQEYMEAGRGWIISWSAPDKDCGFLNVRFYGLVLTPEGSFRNFEAGTAEPLPYGAEPSDFMEALGIGSYMLRLGDPAPAPDLRSGTALKSLAACARRYLDLAP